MTTHKTATHDQWLKARLELLKEEKELTRRSDEIAKRRQALPWVRIDKDYSFDTERGKATLKDLFCGRSQLMVYHFMFGPDYTGGCPSCSSIADGFNGIVPHLMGHDVAFSAVSRAPLEKLQAYKKRMGWQFPWASAGDGDFNRDFSVWFTAEEQAAGTIEYNWRREPAMDVAKMGGNTIPTQRFAEWEKLTKENPVAATAAMTGTDVPTFTRERPGLSTFVLDGDAIYHTYSSYARGLDGIWSMYQYFDRAPKGRNETGMWLRRHDEYGKTA